MVRKSDKGGGYLMLFKRENKILLLIIGLFFTMVSFVVHGQEINKNDKWWLQRHFGGNLEFQNANKMALIQVSGNDFVDEKGDSVHFRGLAISDLDKLENQGEWNQDYLAKAKQWGAEIIRIPVHPISWRERGPKEYLKLLDQAVEWCTALEMYIIIDWHSIGNLATGLFQDPMYVTSRQETNYFWQTIARRYSGINTIVFYEIFNEPTTYRGQLGSITWERWAEVNEGIIDIIRAFDPETIPLVAGFDWAYLLTPLHLNPIDAKGIGYVSHPYPHKRKKPWIPKWEENFGFAADQYPVFATEIGFTLGDYTLEENGEYGRTIINYLEEKGISWIGWVFDAEWHPQMFTSWQDFTPTDNGKFFRKALNGEIQEK